MPLPRTEISTPAIDAIDALLECCRISTDATVREVAFFVQRALDAEREDGRAQPSKGVRV
jgi:hypothetical protein